MNCIGITRSGAQCSRNGRIFFEGNYCSTHFEKKQQDDPEFRARYVEHVRQANEAIEVRLQQVRQAEEDRRIQLQALQAEAVAREAARQQRHRDKKIQKNERLVQDAPLQSPNDIILTARSLMSMWDINLIPGVDIPKAYLFIKFRSSSHVGFPDLIRATVKLIRQGLNNHPIHVRYENVPVDEREAVLTEMRQALIPYGEITNEALIEGIPIGDPFRPIIRNNIRTLEQRAAAARQLQQDLIHNPVVFQRDPEGSINLQAFAQDAQSVHRSSVQNATHRAALALLERPYPEDQNTLEEIVTDFNDPTNVTFRNDRVKERIIIEITNDYFNTEAFSLKYADVLDRVWLYIKTHVEKKELIRRLAQEVSEGYRMCTNGKMARLINVLQGYDETLESAKPRELFQIQISQLMDRPLGEREAAALSLFIEFDIPAEERQVWLDPLLEA